MPMQRPNTTWNYQEAIKNQVIMFLSLFTNLKVVDIESSDETGAESGGTISEYRESKVDIIYTPFERKAINEMYRNHTPDISFFTKLPKISVSLENITYDAERALNFYRRRRIRTNQGAQCSNTVQYRDRMPIPYNLQMNMDIWTNYETHLFQIIENICPFFSPYIVIRKKETNESILTETPRELKVDFDGSVSRNVTFEYGDVDRRVIKSSMSFTIRGWLYKQLEQTPGPVDHIKVFFLKNIDLERDLPANFLDMVEVYGPNWNIIN